MKSQKEVDRALSIIRKRSEWGEVSLTDEELAEFRQLKKCPRKDWERVMVVLMAEYDKQGEEALKNWDPNKKVEYVMEPLV